MKSFNYTSDSQNPEPFQGLSKNLDSHDHLSLKQLIEKLTQTINDQYSAKTETKKPVTTTNKNAVDKAFYAQTNRVLIQDIRRPRRKLK